MTQLRDTAHVILAILGWIGCLAILLIIFGMIVIAPTRHSTKYKAELESFSQPIKVIAVYGKKYSLIAVVQDEKGKRWTAHVYEEDPVVVGDEVELYLNWVNNFCVRRVYHEN